MKPDRAAAEEAVAQAYAKAIRELHTGNFWSEWNREIIARWSRTALLRVKTRAWAIVEGAA